jgi:acyl-lipid omega-6 desaturase (Delta-12 desaturase)
MTTGPVSTPSPRDLPDTKRLPAILSRYRDPSLAWSVMEIAVTLGPSAALRAAMWALMHVSYWLTLALALPAAGFLVRLFMIQHDCGHGAFFRTRAVNDWVGRALGVLMSWKKDCLDAQVREPQIRASMADGAQWPPLPLG